MFSLRWSNSKFPEKLGLSEKLTFQNLMYTVKFEPLANQLETSFVSNHEKVIQGEVLILDASNSIITNMPVMTSEQES